MIKKLKVYEDFAKVLKVFQQPPFYEKLTEQDIKDEFEIYQSNMGGCFAYYENDDILGINCFTYGPDMSHNIIFPDENKVAYLSGLATLDQARGKGVGTELFKHTLEYLKNKELYDYIYLRTNLVGSMSSGIAAKNGFITLKKEGNIYTQACKFERINSNVDDVDIRKFMVLSLNNAEHDKIKIK